MTPENTVAQRTIDVSHLPSTMFDHHEPLWWGNLLGLVIETTMFGILIAVYFSVRMNTSPFPPPRVERDPILYNAVPDLLLPTIILIVFLLSLIPEILLDLYARKYNSKAVKIWLVISLPVGIGLIVLRFYEFDSLHFRWDDNAYGSVIWTILGIHLLHLIVLFFENVFLLFWIFIRGTDDKHMLDLTVTASYWYWIVGIWVLLYTLVYWGPRFL
jgi:cytochrome c oxidase subunit 3